MKRWLFGAVAIVLKISFEEPAHTPAVLREFRLKVETAQRSSNSLR
jgi:hypothetical protein